MGSEVRKYMGEYVIMKKACFALISARSYHLQGCPPLEISCINFRIEYQEGLYTWNSLISCCEVQRRLAFPDRSCINVRSILKEEFEHDVEVDRRGNVQGCPTEVISNVYVRSWEEKPFEHQTKIVHYYDSRLCQLSSRMWSWILTANQF